MPTPESDASLAAPPIDRLPTEVACPSPLTPPPEVGDSRSLLQDNLPQSSPAEDGMANHAEDDNTAGGMAMAQERSMYQHAPETTDSEENEALRLQVPKDTESEKSVTSYDYLSPPSDEMATLYKTMTPVQVDELQTQSALPSPKSMIDEPVPGDEREVQHSPQNGDRQIDESRSEVSTPTTLQAPAQVESPSSYPQGTHVAPELQASNLSSSTTPPWDFSNIRLTPHYPSSLLRPGSRFSGTQQSDKHIYNVDVNILTLSVPQSTLTGYLRICGLTDEHPTLTTFFTGEIIGGPYQKYTFQTKHPSWGATDKTDLQHWARFPAWRPLGKDAKRDLNFAYPPPVTGPGTAGDASISPSAATPTPASAATAAGLGREQGQGWWQRENIFMRWKEWFLVPDHRVTSIQGASFEGFYYICFNQVEGRISGIYFHSRSENRFQQLELKHVFDKGVCGAMEFC